MTILVTGAGGKTGQAVIAALAARGAAVRAFLRQPGPLPGAAEPLLGDMTDEAIWERAMQGVSGVYHICPNMHPGEVEIGRLAIGAAHRAGVGRFVFHSVLHPQTESMPHHWRKLRVEEMLLASGLPFTILQPAVYMQNLRAGWRQIVDTGRLVVPYPVTSPISLVDLEDVAVVAARALLQPGHAAATYECAGTQPLTQVEVAAQLSQVAGRQVTAREMPLAQWSREAQVAGLSAQALADLEHMFRYYAAHGLAGNPTVLRHLLGRDPTSLVACVGRW